jgi:protein-S-isoprenylcysteine O-methyltransferase Ste14
MNSIGPLHLVSFAFLVLGWCLWVFLFYRRLARGVEKAPEKTSRRQSLIGLLLQATGVGLVIAVRRPLGAPLMSDLMEPGVHLLGGLLIVCAVLLTRSALWLMGKEWSLHARVVEGHRLVTGGAFQVVRHPIYTALLALMAATGLVISKWEAILPGFLICLAGTLFRIHHEEILLRAEFKQEYEDYAERVPALIPHPR